MELALNEEFLKIQKKIEFYNQTLLILISQHDELVQHTCPTLERKYMVLIGLLELEVFSLECKILRNKRKIQLIMRYKNRQSMVDYNQIKKQLDMEYKEYNDKLNEQSKKVQESFEFYNNSVELSKEDTSELKKLYRNLVKKLHPDLNPNNSKRQLELFHNVTEAYKNCDLPLLRTLSIMADNLSMESNLSKNSLDELKEKLSNLKNSIERLQNNIIIIKESFPYNQIDFLNDENKIKAKQRFLKNILEEYSKTMKNLEERLKELGASADV